MKRPRQKHPTVRDLGEFGLIRELRGIACRGTYVSQETKVAAALLHPTKRQLRETAPLVDLPRFRSDDLYDRSRSARRHLVTPQGWDDPLPEEILGLWR